MGGGVSRFPMAERGGQMQDRNGREIETGMVVRVSGAYFTGDNGLYLCTHNVGDPGWTGTRACLHKIGKRGKLSKTKGATNFWPLFVTVSDRCKRAEANDYNAEHATIEVVDDVPMDGVREYFKERCFVLETQLHEVCWNYGVINKRSGKRYPRTAGL